MYTQFFGNYLLNNKLISADQLLDAIQYQKQTKLKLGVLAIHEGFMTSSEVDHLHILQTHCDKRFGDIAVDEGYMTQEQVDHLLSCQQPDYLLLSQALVDKGYMTTTQFENALINYQSEYELSDLDFLNEQQDKVQALIEKFYQFDEEENMSFLSSYLTLLFNNIVRFVGDDFTPYPAIKVSAYPTYVCVSQKLKGNISLYSALDMEESVMLALASRYAGETFDTCDEFAEASIEDFLNLHNGLFTVNLSNTDSSEMTLEPPIHENEDVITSDGNIYYIPIVFPFGTVNFILSAYNETNKEEA